MRRYKSFTLKQAGWSLDEKTGHIRLGKKWYGYFQSRHIEGRVKTVTVKRDAKRIKTKSRKLSHKQKGSHNRERARLDLARTYRRMGNQRKDFHNPAGLAKTALSLCEKYALICLETLNIKGMARRHGRKIHSLGFSEFMSILEYEALKFGTQIEYIDRWYASSQICNNCGYKTPELKDLRIREWDCPCCGAHHDRDINAAINIHRVGACLRRATRPTRRGDEVRPVSAGVCC